jgi:hypothetical protein
MNATATLPSIHVLADTLIGKPAPLGELIPFITIARMIDIRCNPFYLQGFTELPDFELHIGDHFIQYERCRHISSQSERIRIVLRRDLIPSKIPGGSGSYGSVDSREYRIPNRRQAKSLLKALLARVKGVDPWYQIATFCTYKFPNTLPMECKG